MNRNAFLTTARQKPIPSMDMNFSAIDMNAKAIEEVYVNNIHNSQFLTYTDIMSVFDLRRLRALGCDILICHPNVIEDISSTLMQISSPEWQEMFISRNNHYNRPEYNFSIFNMDIYEHNIAPEQYGPNNIWIHTSFGFGERGMIKMRSASAIQ